MKKTILFMLMAIGSITMNAQNWNLDNSHSSVNFSITHMVVSEVQGSFKKFTTKDRIPCSYANLILSEKNSRLHFIFNDRNKLPFL